MARLIVFSGAGISADSGIPTFQSNPNVRDKLTRSFANTFPQEFAQVMNELEELINKAKPNAAHLVLAEYDVLIITMNIDKLHQSAGSKNVINVHGDFPDIVLYEDMAPKYNEALKIVEGMNTSDTLLVIGTSYNTMFAQQLLYIAKYNGVKIVEVQKEAAIEVPRIVKKYFANKELQ